MTNSNKRITRYDNSLNTVPMRRWTPEEQNMFFAIITMVRDEGTDTIELDRDNLIELANYSFRTNKNFKSVLESLIDKLEQMKYRERTNNSLKSMTLFQFFDATWTDDLSEMSLLVQVSSRFEYVLNKLTDEIGSFTQFELKQFTNIRSTYAKEMFKQLKQWRTAGKRAFSLEEFKIVMDVPKSYGVKEIRTRVLTPIMNELPEFMDGLKLKTIKANKQGSPVIGYEFTWKKETTKGPFVPGKFDKKDKRKKRPSSNSNKYDKPNNNFKDDVVDPEKQAEYQERLKRIREQNGQSNIDDYLE